LTGEIPTVAQAQSVTKELQKRATIPAHVEATIRGFPKNMHPMTQFSAAVLALQTESEFAKAYEAYVMLT
jgi:citrate synthase